MAEAWMGPGHLAAGVEPVKSVEKQARFSGHLKNHFQSLFFLQETEEMIKTLCG